MKIGSRYRHHGRADEIIQCGTAQDILVSPGDDYVADFVANMNPLGVLTAAADIMVPLDRRRAARRPAVCGHSASGGNAGA